MMPRNVRNFWITLEVDGKAVPVACGPARPDGGFSLTVFQRDRGGIVVALRVTGRALSTGALILDAEPVDSDVDAEHLNDGPPQTFDGTVRIRTVR